MKKFLAVLAIAGTLVACNNDSEGTTTTDTTTNIDVNTTTIGTDTTGLGVDTTGMSADTTGAAGTVDTTSAQ